MPLDIVAFCDLLPAFKEKFLGPPGFHWWAREFNNPNTGERRYDQKKTWKIEDKELREHFSQLPNNKSSKGRIFGSFGITGKFPKTTGRGHFVKWNAVDCDTEEATSKLYTQLLPTLDRLGIEYLLETGGDREERRKLWVFFNNVDFDLAATFMMQLLQDSNLTPMDLGGEQFPLTKPANLVRIPLGHYAKRKRVFPVEIQGELTTDVIKFMRAVIGIKPITEDFIKSLLREPAPSDKKISLRFKPMSETLWLSANLPLPLPEYEFPQLVRLLGKECRVYNRILTESVFDKALDDISGRGHTYGLTLSGVSRYHDKKFRGDEGRDFFRSFLPRFRTKDPESHKWDFYWDHDQKVDWMIPSCKTLKNIHSCKGCPQFERVDFTTPKQFFMSKQVTKRKLDRVVNFEIPSETRANSIHKACEAVLEASRTKQRRTISLKSYPGSGKSFETDRLIGKLVAEGKSVLLAVPSGELAMEHKRRLRGYGVDALCLMSHRNLFKHIADFDCPHYAEIQYHQKLGVPSNKTKSEFCTKCPFKDQCPYPKQYAKAKEDDFKCVIIQHAHFSLKETIFQLLSKRSFDVLVVDEDFVDSLHRHIKPKGDELSALASLKMPWTDDLVQWFTQGGYPGAKLDPSTTDLEIALQTFLDEGVEWNMLEYLNFYEEKAYYDLQVGIFDFHPLPDIPVRLITDATTPKEYLELVLNTEVEEYGADAVLDVLRLNPETKVVQLLDNSSSKTNLKANDLELFIAYLSKAADLAKEEQHINDKILITIHKDEEDRNRPEAVKWETEAKEWLQKMYPDVYPRITLNHLSVGTNSYEDFPVQVIICGVYFSAVHYKRQAYTLKAIQNFYRKRGNLPEEPNVYPHFAEIGEDNNYRKREEFVTRIEPEGVYEYSIPLYPPLNWHYYIAYQKNVGKLQQAIRTRFHSGQKRTLYIMGNVNLPSQMITHSLLTDQVIGYQFISHGTS